MAQSDLSKLLHIKNFIFDVDGVFTSGNILVTEDGHLLRSMSIRDGFAVKHAIKQGYTIIIITGGSSEGVEKRFNKLGVKHVHSGVNDKVKCFNDVKQGLGLIKEECLYMGDDYPDIAVMKLSDIKACPSDAIWEIKELADIVCNAAGGQGAVREIIEKVLVLQGKWDLD